MDALAHWDNVIDFTGVEISALVLGIDPLTLDADQLALRPMLDRLRQAFSWAVEWQIANETGEAPDLGALSVTEQILPSITLKNLVEDNRGGLVDDGLLVEKLMNDSLWVFADQRFARADVFRWIDKNNVRSAFRFGQDQGAHLSQDSQSGDPMDQPTELFIANVTWRAIENGYGVPSETTKEKAFAYFAEHFNFLTQEARNRIAVVINDQKKPGRPKLSKY